MAISTGLATLRRTLAQRMQYWGGDIASNGPAFFSATGTSNTAIDTINRPEPDDEWVDSWIVLNPGSADQTNAPTVWRRLVAQGAWISATGTFTIIGTWPTPYNIVAPGFATGTSTSVNATTMTDTGATWTVNQWKGHTVTLGGSTAIIASNTATVLTLNATGWVGGTPSNGTYTVTMPYELFKTFRPENWLQALNWAIVRAYPKRHIGVAFDVFQTSTARVINWGNIVNNLAVPNPVTAPTITEIANGQGLYQPGAYTFAYTFTNDLGETLISNTTTITIVGTNSQIQFGDITSVPDQVDRAVFYSSQIPNSTQLGQLNIGDAIFRAGVPQAAQVGLMLNGIVYGLIFSNPEFPAGSFPPIYNTTNVDVQELHFVLKRINPGAYPEIWNDLGSDNYKPIGGKAIMLMYFPANPYSLRFICTAPSPSLVKETDVTDEPPEMLFAGGEHYLWNLLKKTSTIVNVNWDNLAKEQLQKFENLKNDYALDSPRTIWFRPTIQTEY